MRSEMNSLNLTLVQGATRWHDAVANREYYGALVREHARDSDLILLPETFLSGFTNHTRGNAEPMEGESVAWLAALAADAEAVITGSLVIREDGRFYNRLIWMRPDGTYETYDKRHLFRMAKEHECYAAGERRLLVELNGWRICPMVCYDLRFPVWTRNRHNAEAVGGMEYDLLLFVANWPAPRRAAWRTLLRARAVENLCFCAGLNRVGVDGNDLPYAGDSAVVGPSGSPMVELGATEQVVTVRLDPRPLLEHRSRFPAWMDADAFSIGSVSSTT